MASADAQNLLTNSSAETGDLTGWTIIENGASGWSALAGVSRDGGYAFATDNAWCKRSQTIDLLALGYTETQLDTAPDVAVSQWFQGYSTYPLPNYSDKAYLKVELRDASNTLISGQVYESGEFTTTSAWVEKAHTFTGYGTGLRYIYWEDGGLGAESWGSTDGPLLDAASLTIDLPAATAPEITVSPTSLDFGDQVVSAGATASQTVTVTNDGDANLEVSFSIIDGYSTEFAITNSPATTPIAPGNSRDVAVAFDPFEVDARTATLRIWSNDTDEPTTEIPLTGSGAPSCSSIVRTDSDPTNAASVDFTVTFSYSVTGVDATDFTIDASGPSGASVSSVSGSGATYTVTVNTGTGDGSLSIDLTDDDSIGTTLTSLGGSGTGNGDYTAGEAYTIDKTVPAITMLGDNPATVLKDATYTDAGATASDTLDGDLTSSISTNNTVNTATLGAYQVTYDVSDAAGNDATQAVRTVYVIDGTPQTIYVDASHSGTEDGQSATPFNTITEGIAAAQLGRSDTVFVRAGTYTESLTLIDTLILESEEGSYHTHIADTGKSAIAVTLAKWATLRGFSITNPTATAVSAPAAITATVTNCVLHNSDVGLQAGAGAAVSCVNNTVVLNTTYGLRGETGATFSVLKNNCIASNGTGVSADVSAVTDGGYNNFYGNTTDYDGPSAAGSDFVSDPLFVDAASTNFHLEDGSPCRDAGDPDPAFDDVDTSRNDIGADGGPEGVQDTTSPTASFTPTPSSGSAPLTVDFDGSASSDEWGIGSYSWDFDSSDGIQEDATGATPQHQFTTANTYTVTLTVTDNSGLTNSTTDQVSVSEATNDLPTASASAAPRAGAIPFEVQFTGAGSDPDGGTVTFSWNFDGDDVEDSTDQSPLYTYPGGTDRGHYVATLTVTDDELSSTEASVTLTLTQETVEASAVIDPAAGGSLAVDDGSSAVDDTAVTVPIGATVDDMVATIGWAETTPAPPTTGWASEVVELGPAGVSLSQAASVTLMLDFEPVHSGNLGVSIYDDSTAQWVTTGISNVTYSDTPAPLVTFDTTGFSFVVATYPAATEDINEDGGENAIDVQLCINAVLGIPLPGPYRADIDGDGFPTAIDLQRVINAVLGL